MRELQVCDMMIHNHRALVFQLATRRARVLAEEEPRINAFCTALEINFGILQCGATVVVAVTRYEDEDEDEDEEEDGDEEDDDEEEEKEGYSQRI